MANQAYHILEPIVPLVGCDIGGSQSQIALAFLGTAQAFGKRSAINIEMVIKCKLLVLLHVSDGENTNTNLAQHVPFSCYAVGFTRVINEPSQITLIGGVNNFTI